MSKRKITFLTPCLNEEKTISSVLNRIISTAKKLKIKNYDIVVSDSGSTDESIKKIKLFKNVRLVHPNIKGYGAALDWGIKKSNSEYVFFADSDQSYDFSEFKKFIRFIPESVDLVLGNRLNYPIRSNAMPLLNRYLGTPILSLLIRLIYRISTYDCNSGMRLVKRSFYMRLNMRNSGMEWASELIIRTALNKGSYQEVDINFYKDKRGRSPHLRPWLDGWRHLKAILLLRPSALLVPAILFGIGSKMIFPGYSWYSLVITEFALLLSIVAAWLINIALVSSDNKNEFLLRFFLSLPLVKMSFLFTLFALILAVISSTGITSDMNLFIYSIVILYDMWVFFVETIKTHIVSSLNKK